MGAWSYTVKHLSATTSGASWTTLSNVTGGNYSDTRDNVVDSLPKRRGRIFGRVPSGLPTIAIGDGIQITSTGGAGGEFIVADFRINYGINSNADTWTIELEDQAALQGRAIVSISWAANASSYYTYQYVSPAGPDYPGGINPPPDTSKRMSAQTITNENMATVARQILDTNQMTQYFASWQTFLSSVPDLTIPPPGSFNVGTGPTFTDGSVTPITSGQWRFDSIDVASLANNYWDKVVAQPVGLAEQVVGTGSRGYTFATYSVSTADAADCAGYTLSRFAVASKQPLRITAQVESQTSSVTAPQLGQSIRIDLRGTTSYAYIVGCSWDFQPAGTRLVLDLAPYAGSNTLILDDAVLGRLDENRLGF